MYATLYIRCYIHHAIFLQTDDASSKLKSDVMKIVEEDFEHWWKKINGK